jgi:hypothetical protein
MDGPESMPEAAEQRQARIRLNRLALDHGMVTVYIFS